MKVIAILAFGDSSCGGVYQYTQSIIDALSRDSHNKYVVYCFDACEYECYNLEVRLIKHKKKSLYANVIRFIQLLFIFRTLGGLVSKELDDYEDIDLFVSPSGSAYPHFYINKPYVFTLHDMQERYYPSFFTKADLFFRWLTKRALSRCAEKIICESDFVKNDILKHTSADTNMIEVIQSPPPVEFVNFSFEISRFETVKKKYFLPKRYLFYPAQCWKHKNHSRLVDAFKIIVNDGYDVSLILSGSKNSNYNSLVRKVSESGLSDRIIHLGYIDYDELPYIYSMSEMLIMPTLFESVSLPIFEAFSLRVPVCSSDVVALPEQVGCAGVIFNPFDEFDMAEKIKSILDDDHLAKEVTRLGFEKVTSFNHQEYMLELLKCINTLKC